MNEQRVLWGEDGFASASGWAFAHCVDVETGEFICSQDVWVSVGTGLPAGAFLEQPPQVEDGKAIVRQGGEWVLVDDLRGKTAYNKQTRQSTVIDSLGSLLSEFTLIAPKSLFDVWDEESGSWIKDAQAEQVQLTQQATSQRSALLSEASIEIASLLDALDPDVTPNPVSGTHEKYLKWRSYRAELATIDCAVHPVQWPDKP